MIDNQCENEINNVNARCRFEIEVSLRFEVIVCHSFDISKEFVRRPEDRTLSVVRRIGRKLAKARLFGKRPFSKTSKKVYLRSPLNIFFPKQDYFI